MRICGVKPWFGPDEGGGGAEGVRRGGGGEEGEKGEEDEVQCHVCILIMIIMHTKVQHICPPHGRGRERGGRGGGEGAG